MSKVPLQNVTNLQTSSAVTTINNNSTTITTAFDNTLSRDGTTPNQMGANLDMNSNRIINLPAAMGGTEPVRLAEFNNVVFGSGSGISNVGTLPAHTIPIATGTSTLNSVLLTGGQLLVGATGANPTAQTVSGDGTLTAGGALTVTKTSGTSFAPSATTDTTNATNITSGTLPATRLPALTGDVTSTVNTGATAIAAIKGNTVSGTSGSGNVVFSTSPSLTTPTLGVASATSVNKVTLTPPFTGSTLTINDGKTLAVGNTITLTASADGTTQNFPAVSGTLFNSGAPITNTNLATMPANTLKGNVTGSTATPTDFTIDGLTLKAPVGADELIIWDVAGTAIKKATVASIGTSAGVSGIDGKTGAFTTGNGLDSTGGNLIELTSARRTMPTTQVFTTGSGTYITPANCLWIEVMLVGGGAGGAGGNSGGVGSGGGNTTFGTSLLTANGALANVSYINAGTPGSASGGYLNISGGWGTGGGVATNNNVGCAGGSGGNSSLGGAGAGVYDAVGKAAATNSGSGGGGGGTSIGNPVLAGTGGSAGGTCKAIINTPASTYAYAVGAAGSGGAGGDFAGGNGAQGIITVIEHYGT